MLIKIQFCIILLTRKFLINVTILFGNGVRNVVIILDVIFIIFLFMEKMGFDIFRDEQLKSHFLRWLITILQG